MKTIETQLHRERMVADIFCALLQKDKAAAVSDPDHPFHDRYIDSLVGLSVKIAKKISVETHK